MARSPKVVCIVEARFSSTRLPGKVLMDLHGATMLARLLERVSLARTIDEIVVATTVNPADDAVAAEAERNGAHCFRGSEEDVLDRVVRAAESRDADLILEVTGDCPLIDPGLIDKAVGDFLVGGADFVSNILPHSTPRGTDVRVFRTRDLAEINARSTDPADHEHVSLHFWEHLDRYRCRNVEMDFPEAVAHLRWTVDMPEDLELVRAIYDGLYDSNPVFTLVDALQYVNDNPSLLTLNHMVEQKAVRS